MPDQGCDWCPDGMLMSSDDAAAVAGSQDVLLARFCRFLAGNAACNWTDHFSVTSFEKNITFPLKAEPSKT